MAVTSERALDVDPCRRPPLLLNAEQEAVEQGRYDIPIVDVDAHVADEMDTRKLIDYKRNPNLVRAFDKYRELEFRRVMLGVQRRRSRRRSAQQGVRAVGGRPGGDPRGHATDRCGHQALHGPHGHRLPRVLSDHHLRAPRGVRSRFDWQPEAARTIGRLSSQLALRSVVLTQSARRPRWSRCSRRPWLRRCLSGPRRPL
jgi:hypothetical protein